MSEPTQSLYETLTELGLTPNSPELLSLATTIVRYVIGVDDAYACQRRFKEAFDFHAVGSSPQRFRLHLSDTSYLHLNIKFFCLNVIKRGMTRNNLIKFKDDFGILRNDVVLLKKVFQQRGLRTELRNSDRLSKIEKDQIDKRAFKGVFRTFDNIYPSLMKHIKNRTYTKLRFVSVSSNMEFYDLHMELMCKALQTYIKMVPTDKTELHIANYLRSSVSNHTTNMIKSYTTQKRQRMVQGASDGFGGHHYEIPVMSENQLFKTFGLDNASYETMRSSDSVSEETTRQESDMTFQMLLQRFGKTQKRKVFIMLIALQEHSEFTEHLREKDKIAPDQDNVDFGEIAGEDGYLKEVCDFLSLAENRARNFMKYIARVAYPEKFSESK